MTAIITVMAAMTFTRWRGRMAIMMVWSTAESIGWKENATTLRERVTIKMPQMVTAPGQETRIHTSRLIVRAFVEAMTRATMAAGVVQVMILTIKTTLTTEMIDTVATTPTIGVTEGRATMGIMVAGMIFIA